MEMEMQIKQKCIYPHMLNREHIWNVIHDLYSQLLGQDPKWFGNYYVSNK